MLASAENASAFLFLIKIPVMMNTVMSVSPRTIPTVPKMTIFFVRTPQMDVIMEIARSSALSAIAIFKISWMGSAAMVIKSRLVRMAVMPLKISG